VWFVVEQVVLNMPPTRDGCGFDEEGRREGGRKKVRG
jgi:hypothetical protein